MTPTAPVLVPDLAGGAAAEVIEVREAAVAAAATLPERWIAVGVGPADEIIGPDIRGTFAGYGVDVPVALSPEAGPRIAAMPLCALFGAWLRGQTNPRAVVEVRAFAAGHGAAAVSCRPPASPGRCISPAWCRRRRRAGGGEEKTGAHGARFWALCSCSATSGTLGCRELQAASCL